MNLQAVSLARGGPAYPDLFRKVVAVFEGVGCREPVALSRTCP